MNEHTKNILLNSDKIHFSSVGAKIINNSPKPLFKFLKKLTFKNAK
jgi:hypothetical protein